MPPKTRAQAIDAQPIEAAEPPPPPPQSTHELPPLPPPAPGDREIAPLWDDTIDSPDRFLLVSQIKSTTVFRQQPDPANPKRKKRVACISLPPRATWEDLQAARGGGDYLLAAIAHDGSFLGWKEWPIEGPPIIADGRDRGGLGIGPAPIMETTNGMVGIEGLKPEQQWMFAQSQIHNAQTREDARFMIDAFVRALGTGAMVRTSNNQLGGEMMGFLQEQLQAQQRHNEQLRDQIRQLENRLADHRISAATNSANDPNRPVRMLTEAAIDRLPAVLDYAMKKMDGGGGNGTPTP